MVTAIYQTLINICIQHVESAVEGFGKYFMAYIILNSHYTACNLTIKWAWNFVSQRHFELLCTIRFVTVIFYNCMERVSAVYRFTSAPKDNLFPFPKSVIFTPSFFQVVIGYINEYQMNTEITLQIYIYIYL